ncbi:UDP-glycosyltransferase 91A1-like [Impatiens glandulifera]|uniref:UDP-glycosyltransferase 91A1-like n=1 Tax=Impatiens glandulifera TaxID=253017 RepID=UPI001FB0E179|nr:UDP-glycosyltransferase 91A1-like [Impatiens glandulifera]
MAIVHVVMVPFVAFGHMIPFLELGISLAKSGSIKISFISTPKNIDKLRPRVPPALDHLINLVALPWPSVDLPLPAGIESTADIPLEKSQFLKIAYDLLKQPFKNFVTQNSPDWILVDGLAHWASEVAVECNIPSILLSIFCVATSVFFGPPEYLHGDGQKLLRSSPESLTSLPPWIDFPSTLAYPSCHSAGIFFGFFGDNASGIPDAHRVAKVTTTCKAIAVRSCRELEGEYIDLLGKLTGKRIIPVGLFPPSPPENLREIEKDEAYKWLEKLKPKSVVYVSFGSEWKVTKEQVNEIANGLEKSGVQFLWTLRTPIWSVETGVEVLPPGFVDRTSDRGRTYIADWFPQMEILSHPSIGGCLFHAGYGTAVESLQFGHCLITLPLVFDQPLVSRMLVDKGLALEVERKEDGSFDGDAIARALKRAMGSQLGEAGEEELIARASEISKALRDQKQNDEYLNDLVEFLING